MASAHTRSPFPANRRDVARDAPAVIGAGTRVRGRLTGDGDVNVLGHVEGEVDLRGELFIAEGGRVVSNVSAASLRIAGTLDGDITAVGEVIILAGARVTGDVRGASVSLDEGAQLNGRLDADFLLPRELAAGSGSGGRADDDGPTVRH